MTWLVVPACFPTCTQQSVNQYNTTIIFCLAKKGPHLFLAEKTICLSKADVVFCYGITAQQVDGTRRATAKK
jgi:hypothetical protein